MKANLLRSLLPLALVFTMISCSSEDSPAAVEDTRLVTNYEYSPIELQIADLINDHRESMGLNRLQLINHISYKSEEHNEYMISNQVVNHDYFQQRSSNIIAVLGAVKVNENVAYNYTTAQGVVNAWLNSPGHRATIEGNFTNFGISVREDADYGSKYYTNIFIRK